LHWGEAVVSRLGGAQHQQVSLSGDAVNLCSRLLDIARPQRAAIVATEAFVARLGAPISPEPEALRNQALRGLHGEYDLYFWPVSGA
jgi:adenylate cyclase